MLELFDRRYRDLRGEDEPVQLAGPGLMAYQPKLIVQVARGSAVERQLTTSPPESLARGEIVVESGYTTADGHLEPPDAGTVVLSVPSPESLAREADEVRQVLVHAGAASSRSSSWSRPPRSCATTSSRRFSRRPPTRRAP